MSLFYVWSSNDPRKVKGLNLGGQKDKENYPPTVAASTAEGPRIVRNHKQY